MGTTSVVQIIGYYPSPTSNGIAALDARNGEILLGGEGPKNSTGSKPCCNEENLRFKCEIQVLFFLIE